MACFAFSYIKRREVSKDSLATQIGAQLKGITYIFDEPSIGLHQRDNHRLIRSLQRLRDLGNSVLVVEHDRDIMLAADYIIDMGPKAGKFGGEVIAAGRPEDLCKTGSTETALYLRSAFENPPYERRTGNGKTLILEGAKGNNLKNITVAFPLGTLIVVTGVSGSGKSTLIMDILYPVLFQHCNRIKKYTLPYSDIKGLEYIDKVIAIDQAPIGRIPRSNAATYCGFFTDIRMLFSLLPESKLRGYKVGRFSFNVKGGRCDTCEGAGFRVVEMGFLPAVHIPCETCYGKRYNRATLDIRYKGKSINDVLEMSVDEAVRFFENIPQIHRKIKTLQDVGLGYIALGQSAVLLSGGEAQRVKLATELSKKATSETFYILDEPTTGLHFSDIKVLMKVLNQLVEKGNTVLIIEHNMDVIKMADYIIDLGPEGGSLGGELTAVGTPEILIKKYPKNITAKYLKKEFEKKFFKNKKIL